MVLYMKLLFQPLDCQEKNMRALENDFTLFIEISRLFQKSKCLQIAEEFCGKDWS
jgi:hypothetical protein